MPLIPRVLLDKQRLNKVLHISAMILCVGLIGSHYWEYERFYNDRWSIKFHDRDTLMLQAKECPNGKIRDNSGLYMFRQAYKDKVIVVLNDDRITSQLLRNTIVAQKIHEQKIEDAVLYPFSDSGALYRGFPVFIDSEEKLREAKKIFLFFEESQERWFLRAL